MFTCSWGPFLLHRWAVISFWWLDCVIHVQWSNQTWLSVRLPSLARACFLLERDTLLLLPLPQPLAPRSFITLSPCPLSMLKLSVGRKGQVTGQFFLLSVLVRLFKLMFLDSSVIWLKWTFPSGGTLMDSSKLPYFWHLFYNSLAPGIYDSTQDGLRGHVLQHLDTFRLSAEVTVLLQALPIGQSPRWSPASSFPFGPFVFSRNTHTSMLWQTPAHPSEADCPWFYCLKSDQPLSHTPVHSLLSLPPVWVRK